MEQSSLSIKEQLIQLYKSSFDDCQGYVDYFFANKTSMEKSVYLIKDNQVISALHLVDKTVKVRGVDFFCPYIVAASTMQQYRGNKLMERVMFSAFDKLNAQSTALTALYPVSRTYYKKYGFIDSTYADTITIKNIDNNASQTLAIPKLLKNIYDKYISECNMYIVRSEKDFSNYIAEWEASENKVEVFSYNEKAVWVAHKEGNIEEVFGDSNVLSHVSLFSGKQVDIIGKSKPFAQTRIINPIMLLNQINYDKDGQICFNINDSFYPNNNCYVDLEVINGKGICIKQSKITDTTVDITQLSRAICGTNDDYGILSKVLTPKVNFCLDKY